MVRIIASALVLLVAVPAVSASSDAPTGVDLVGPADCCCPDESIDAPEPAQLEPPCCCELRPATPGAEAQQSPAVIGSADAVAVAPLAVGIDMTLPTPVSSVVAVRAKARAPPAGSLFAHHTSLLL